MNLISILVTTFLWSLIQAETHTWYFETGWVNANPDGLMDRLMIGFNGSWPLPTLRIKKGDTVNLYLTNGFKTENTTLHFHGMFQNGTGQMDGPEMVTQCPIPPGETFLYNFTVTDQVGTYWYHSHTMGQTGDGMRGVFIIEDPDFPYEYDEEVILTVADLYHKTSDELMPLFMSRFNPTGAEPIPQNFLFNDTMNATWKVEPNKTYFVRLLNIGGFVSQYIWMEDHNFTVVEADGIYVEKNETSMIYITVAQRYGLLITTKNETDRNYAFMTAVDTTMLDLIPDALQLNTTNYIVYNEDADLPKPFPPPDTYLDDFYLKPLDNTTILDDADYTITLDVVMDNLGNGINYAFFNNITYVKPKVPTLMTALSAGELATNAMVYGSNTNSFVLQPNDVIDVVVNNKDTGRHPFHMHGHVFQLIERHPEVPDDQEHVAFNASDHAEWPEKPMHRDTVWLEPLSYMVLRFKATNPGVWMFHCHLEWHLDQGLAILLVEDPIGIQNDPRQQLNDNSKQICEKAGVPWEGNAAGNNTDFLVLTGENVQHAPLPAGFTARGIVALVFSCIAGILGVTCIAIYGMSDVNEEKVAQDLDVDVDMEESEDSETKYAEESCSSYAATSTR